MKHIQKVILTNFQQWKKGNINFKEGLNVIVGDTESGKSTIFRSIYSILTGKMPEDYIRKGTKCCEVEIHFGDGSIFKRKRSKKDNIAQCGNKVFERVGKEIPSEYFQELGKTGINFGKEISLCSYSQFDPHFFITLSDYDKSKLIGTICGIDIVDKLVDGINKDIRNNNSNIKYINGVIIEKKSELLDKQPQYENLENVVNICQKALENANEAFKTLENVSQTASKLSEINQTIKILEEQQKALVQRNFDSSLSIELAKINDLRDKLQRVNEAIKQKQSELANIKSGEINTEDVNLLKKVFDIKNRLTEVNNSIKIYTNVGNKLSDELKTLEQQKKDLLCDYEQCPLCGSIL